MPCAVHQPAVKPAVGSDRQYEPPVRQFCGIVCGVSRSAVSVEDHAFDHNAPAAHRGSDLHRVTGERGIRALRRWAGRQPTCAQIPHRGERGRTCPRGGDRDDVATPLKVRRRRGEVLFQLVGELCRLLSCVVNPLLRFGFRPCRPCRRMDSAAVFTLKLKPSSPRRADRRGCAASRSCTWRPRTARPPRIWSSEDCGYPQS